MKSILAALALFLSSSAALAVDYHATINANATVRAAPQQGAEAVGSLSPGTQVAVDVCFAEGAYCLIKGTGFVAGDLMTVDNGNGLTVKSAEQQKWARIREEQSKPRTYLSSFVRTEGDSYMNGAYGFRLTDMLAKQLKTKVTNTAVGSSTVDEEVDRIVDPANKALLNEVTIFWDGSINGATDAAAYVEKLATGIEALGHDHFLIVLPAHPGEVGAATEQMVTDLLKAKWPKNTLDWRPIIPNANGVIATDQYAKPDTDTVHLGQAPLEAMAEAIVTEVKSKGWL